ncbi:GumC family protein [Argonema galeatum]|uniref:GumC family protein n=1 Tax=Argonema galeatum TaxID=2942762 RepID=UPI0020131F98|nr:polysaccharide biosynthesis tyrosine autokinase [Argonema galeatum]MCL1467686.1 polysaccharide biosynthesis tyrosine autokinase [Argonema galeatum A003/A1]
MNTEHEFHPLSPKRNAKHSQSLSQSYTDQPSESDDSQLSIGWVLAVLRRRAFVILFVAIALTGTLGSLLVLKAKKTPPVYEGLFKLLVEPVTSEAKLTRLALLDQTLGGRTAAQDIRISTDTLDYETQIRVLQSAKLMEPVIKELQTQYPDITYNSLSKQLKITRINYLQDGKQLGTKILEVSYQDDEIKKIKLVLDKIAQAYLAYSLQQRLTSTQQGIKFIEEQLPHLENRVDTLQRQLQKLRQENNLTDPKTQGEELSRQATYLANARADVEQQLAQARIVYANLKKIAQDNPTSLLSNDAVAYGQLLRQAQELDSQIAQTSVQFQQDSIPMKILLQKQENMRSLLRQEAEAIVEKAAGQIRELEARQKAIVQGQGMLNQKLKKWPYVDRQYADIQRNLQIATDALNQFLAKQEGLRISAAQEQAPWELIVAPEVKQDEKGNFIPATANKTKRQLMIVAILSFLLSIGVGFLVEIINNVFHTPEEIRAATKLPILAVIPLAKRRKKLASVAKLASLSQLAAATNLLVLQRSEKPKQDKDFMFWEAFRSLHTNIRLLSAESPVESLVISSAGPGDGKSTVALHLAQTAAAIGQRVLLVDADLRRPKLHKMMDLPNVRGLSDAIATDIGLNEVIQRSRSGEAEAAWQDNLFVLTAGPVPSDPIKLLSSSKMWHLMEQFQAFFDLVIYDTPPLVGLADGSLLASHAGGIIVVVNIDKTDRFMLMKALDGLTFGGASVLGIVANGVKGKAASSYQ